MAGERQCLKPGTNLLLHRLQARSNSLRETVPSVVTCCGGWERSSASRAIRRIVLGRIHSTIYHTDHRFVCALCNQNDYVLCVCIVVTDVSICRRTRIVGEIAVLRERIAG